jgi:hypothetical protein
MARTSSSCTASYLAIACLDVRLALVDWQLRLKRNWTDRNWMKDRPAVRFADRHAWR